MNTTSMLRVVTAPATDWTSAGRAQQVLLMTLHASKGLEFDCVFVIGVNEGFLPLWKYTQDDGTNPLIEEVRFPLPLALRRSVGRTRTQSPVAAVEPSPAELSSGRTRSIRSRTPVTYAYPTSE